MVGGKIVEVLQFPPFPPSVLKLCPISSQKFEHPRSRRILAGFGCEWAGRVEGGGERENGGE